MMTSGQRWCEPHPPLTPRRVNHVGYPLTWNRSSILCRKPLVFAIASVQWTIWQYDDNDDDDDAAADAIAIQ